MKILFIENRYRTLFWRAIGNELEKSGHEIKYLVQNHFFGKNTNQDYIIPYPGSCSKSDTSDKRNLELIKSDRNINYFQHKNTGHYDYYRNEIEKFIKDYKPDIVFGESTAFHELLTIDICKEKGILYLHPSSSRYPVGRFAFYQYDTLIPYEGSQEELDKEEAQNIISSIVNRTTKPDYMKIKKPSFNSRIKRVKELLSHSFSYYSGEHYNTPDPFVKRKIERKKNYLISAWDKVAFEREELIKKESFKILYPMQMQPEANLDVWGRPYRNQLDTIRQILLNSSEDVQLIIKPNPKSKYELTEELIEFVRNNERIIPILHKESMDNVLPIVDLVITATGTIAIECILSNKPVLTLIKTLNNENTNCIFLENFENLMIYIKMIKTELFSKISDNKKIEFLNKLNQTSFVGRPYETALLDQTNVRNCFHAFKTILKSLKCQ